LASIAAALEGTTERLARARLRAAQVDIALAAAETATARLAGEELDEIAGDYATSGLQAMAHHARGAVLLTEGHTGEALETLQTACRLWRDLHVPYEVARVRLLLATAYRALGDSDAAALELDAAATTFTELGATQDLRRVAELRGRRALPGA
jgi:tetratricopeptide (TPR) repeat protein